jgi:hypothetical protein
MHICLYFISTQSKNLYLGNYLLVCTEILLQYCNFVIYYNYIYIVV